MRVGLVCPYDLSVPGGVQRQVLELAARLDSAGHPAEVVGPGIPATDHVDVVWTSAGPSVSFRGNRSRAPLAMSPTAWKRVREALVGVDVVHVHEPLMPIVSLSAVFSPKPVVATFHAAPPAWARRLYRVVSPLVGTTLRRAQLTAVSRVAAAPLPASWGIPSIIPNGLDVAQFESEADRLGTQVLYLGRDEPRKGLDLILSGWKVVRTAVPEATLVVAGATRATTDPSIRFEGRVSEARKRELLATSAVFVAPNRGGESFGIVIAEAMAAGCALVASDLPAFRSVAGESAMFFTTGSAGDLATCVTDLLRDEQRRKDLAQRAEKSVERLDWSHVLDSYLGIYRAAIDAA